jgi:hypothetical protein
MRIAIQEGAGKLTGHVIVLDDEDDGIQIAKSGAPEPSPELHAWLTKNCVGEWRYRVDGVFNVYFCFDAKDDAERFSGHWKPRRKASNSS